MSVLLSLREVFGFAGDNPPFSDRKRHLNTAFAASHLRRHIGANLFGLDMKYKCFKVESRCGLIGAHAAWYGSLRFLRHWIEVKQNRTVRRNDKAVFIEDVIHPAVIELHADNRLLPNPQDLGRKQCHEAIVGFLDVNLMKLLGRCLDKNGSQEWLRFVRAGKVEKLVYSECADPADEPDCRVRRQVIFNLRGSVNALQDSIARVAP